MFKFAKYENADSHAYIFIKRLQFCIHQIFLCLSEAILLCVKYGPYKSGSKHTKAEAARQLGLDPAAMALLEGSDYVSLEPLICPDKPGRETIHEVEANISYIIADVITKDKEVLDQLRGL